MEYYFVGFLARESEEGWSTSLSGWTEKSRQYLFYECCITITKVLGYICVLSFLCRENVLQLTEIFSTNKILVLMFFFSRFFSQQHSTIHLLFQRASSYRLEK